MPQSEKICFACSQPMDPLARVCANCGADQIRRPSATPSFGKARGFGRAQSAAEPTQGGDTSQQRQKQQDSAPYPSDRAARHADTVASDFHVDSFSGAILSCFLKYATFRGRANRAEFWYFNLFLFITGFVLSIVDASMQAPMSITLNWIWSLATLIPFYAVSVRRMHDQDKSGFFVLLALAGLILLFAGAIFLLYAKTENIGSDFGYAMLFFGCALILWQLVLYCLPGTEGPNRYGPSTRSW